MKRFTLTAEHIKLARAFRVEWKYDEYGAPCVDSRRPYRSSAVINDIHEILTGESVGRLSEAEEQRYAALHEEMEYALQIVLVTGSFEPGVYEADTYGRNWRRVE